MRGVEIDCARRPVPKRAATALRLACTLAAAACAAGAASAAEKAAPLVPSWKQSHFEQGNIAVQSVYRLAVCARVKKREAAEALLATSPGSPEEAARLRAAMPSGETDCPIRARKLTISSPALVRGALAEALYNGDRTRPRRAVALPSDGADRPSSSESELAVARWVARCAVRRDPSLAHEVLKFSYGSIGEQRALRVLKPAFIACLPPGSRLQVSRLNIRALIAEELYRASVTFKESFANAEG